jgi:hypothetical protein
METLVKSGDFCYPTPEISENLSSIGHIVIKAFVKLGDLCYPLIDTETLAI